MLGRAVLAAAMILASMPAVAEHCTTWTTSDPTVDTNPTGVGPRYYVANDDCDAEGCIFSIWVYEESNGITGLQRGDDVYHDTCHGMIASDTILH